ncbi:iron-sulfur cluster assembly scaffold protein NifU [Erysipelotrichaceae bacterium]|nr:iron-sulfur cluster assembly scaffold protein NifU [Erysipelotrichaceae bacterium]
MSYSDKEQWYRQIIMDHYNLPRNKGLVDSESYTTVHLKNPSCGDDLKIQIELVGDIITDIRYEGSGCAICCSSASMLTENVKNKSVQAAEKIISNFSLMITGQLGYDEDILGEAISLQGVAHLPPRIKCATLGYKALERLLLKSNIDDEDIQEVK